MISDEEGSDENDAKGRREIKDPTAIRAIMEEALVCRIGLSDDGMPYVVPMNFGLGENCLYLHCAAEGRKLDIIRRNDRVCFEMDLFREVILGQSPCGCSCRATRASSASAGRSSWMTPAKRRPPSTGSWSTTASRRPSAYTDEIFDKTTVIRIDIESLTAKRRE